VSALMADEEKQKKAAKKAEDAGDDGDEVAFFSNDSQQIKYDSSLVIQSDQFLKKWCPTFKKGELFQSRNNPTVREFKEIA